MGDGKEGGNGGEGEDGKQGDGDEIMEKYLPMIYSFSIKYDPLVNVDFTESFEREFSNEDSASADGIVLNSDTPQGRVNKTDILAGNYASNTSGNETSSSGSSEGSESYTKRTKGNSGISATAQALLKQYRDNIKAIDRDIIKEVKILDTILIQSAPKKYQLEEMFG